MKSLSSRFTAVAEACHTAQAGSGRAVLAVGLFAAAIFIQQPVYATPLPSAASAEREAASKLAELEKVFWVCDHLATKQGVDLNLAATCGAATDELKRVKFNDDFEKMLAWWRLNKVAQHEALDRINTAQASSETTEIVEYPD